MVGRFGFMHGHRAHRMDSTTGVVQNESDAQALAHKASRRSPAGQLNCKEGSNHLQVVLDSVCFMSTIPA